MFLVRRMMDLDNEETNCLLQQFSHQNGVRHSGLERIREVLKLQKKCIRICRRNRRSSCRDPFKKYGILTVCSLYILTCVLQVFDNRRNFPTNNHYHDYKTRKRNELMVFKHTAGSSQNGTNHKCIKLFNKLPPELKDEGKSQIFFQPKPSPKSKNFIHDHLSMMFVT